MRNVINGKFYDYAQCIVALTRNFCLCAYIALLVKLEFRKSLVRKRIEPSSFLKRFLFGDQGLAFSNSNRQKADQFIAIRYMQYLRHFVTDPVIIRNMPFVPAALIAKIHNSQQHVFYRRGIILHAVAALIAPAVLIRNHALRQHADHGDRRQYIGNMAALLSEITGRSRAVCLRRILHLCRIL